MNRKPAYVASGVEGYTEFYGSYSIQLADGKWYVGNLCPHCRQVIQVVQERVRWAAEDRAHCPRCGVDLKPYLSSEFVFPAGVDAWEYMQWVGAGPVRCHRCGRVTNAGLVTHDDSRWELGHYPDGAEYWRAFCERCWSGSQDRQKTKKRRVRSFQRERHVDVAGVVIDATVILIVVLVGLALLACICAPCLLGIFAGIDAG